MNQDRIPGRVKLAFAGGEVVAVAAVTYLFFALCWPAWSHDWFPATCCNGGDCKVIKQSQVQATKNGFVFPGNPEVVPYSSPKIRHTPPEGDGAFAICTKGGVPDAPIICLYIPTWNS